MQIYPTPLLPVLRQRLSDCTVHTKLEFVGDQIGILANCVFSAQKTQTQYYNVLRILQLMQETGKGL